MCRVTVHGSKGVEECPFVWPPDSESAFAAGIGAQNAAFIELVRGAAQLGATADDAVAALEAAESAAALL
jgi:hypothetical protein